MGKRELVKDEYEHLIDEGEGSGTDLSLQERIDRALRRAWKLTNTGFALAFTGLILYFVIQFVWIVP